MTIQPSNFKRPAHGARPGRPAVPAHDAATSPAREGLQ